VTSREAAHLTTAQVADLLRAAEDTRIRAALRIARAHRLRRGEALALRWADVDLEKASCVCAARSPASLGRLVVTEPKTARSKRFVPLSAPAERLLQDVRASQDDERRRAGSVWQETGFVFTTVTGEPCDPRNALRALKVAAEKAGLPHAGCTPSGTRPPA
jgi:integrase